MEQEIKFYIYAALIFLFIVIKVIGKKKNPQAADADQQRRAAEQMREAAERRRQAAERARAELLHSLRVPVEIEPKPQAVRRPQPAKPEQQPRPAAAGQPATIPEEGVRVTHDSPAPMKDNGPTRKEIEEHRRKWRAAIINSEILQPKF